jgi:hypothetical protein
LTKPLHPRRGAGSRWATHGEIDEPRGG